MMIAITALTLTLTAAASDAIVLSSFDESQGPVWKWQDQNDPVMGGASTSSFHVDDDTKTGIFNGTCAIVPFLGAPGFAKITTSLSLKEFPDVSQYLDGHFQLRVRSSTPTYGGYKVAFRAKGVPRTSQYGGGSFKADFGVHGSDWQVVSVPFNSFSYDWSGYTGTCDTKDPNGQQHYCCTAEHPEVCPTAEYLASITGVEVWAEGVEGDFHIEVDWLAASN